MTTLSPNPAQHPSALALHEYHLALLPREEADVIARHVSGCDRCRSDLETLDAEHSRFDREVFPLTRAAVARGPVPRWWRRWTLPSVGVLAAATCLLVFAPAFRSTSPDDILRTKGQGDGHGLLAIFAARGDSVMSVQDGKTPLRAGDRIRFVLWPAGLQYAVIASVDGAGRTTIYHPYGGLESAPLLRGPRVEIPGSILLDGAKGPERVFALLSARPLQTAAVVGALEKLARQGSAAVRRTERLPLKAVQQSILLEKSD